MRLLRTTASLATPGCAAAALLAASALYAWFTTFSGFSSYDDEGYLLLSVKEFLEGEPLYERVYSQYGPTYYLFNRLIFGSGRLLSHDAVRLLTVVLWLLAALLFALFVWATTQRFFLAAAVHALVLFESRALVSEPGHPQGLNTVLTAAAVLPFALGWARSPAWLVGVGGLAAAVVLVKINVGVFLILALLLAATTSVRGDRSATLVGLGCSAAALSLPTAILWRHLGTPWGTAYVSVTTLSLLSILLTAWTSRQRSARDRGAPRHAWAWLGVGLFSGSAALLGGALAHGNSAAGLLEGVLIRPFRFSALYFSGLPFPTHTTVMAACGMAVFLGLRHASRDAPAGRARWVGRALALAFLLLVVAGDAIDRLTYALPLLWIVPFRASGSAPDAFLPRLALVLVAALQSLQAYPVPGTQLALATIWLIPCAALCAHDLASEAFQRWPALAILRGRWPVLVAPWAIVGVCALLAFRAARDYQALVPLALPGAERVRVPEFDAAVYGWMTANLRAHCDRFVTVPGYGSLYLWTQLDPPTGFNTTVWWFLLDEVEQREIVAALDREPRACVISLNHPRWLSQINVGGRLASTLPLARYILENFETVGRAGAHELMVRTGRAPIEPLQCVVRASRERLGDCRVPAQRSLSLSTPVAPGRRLARVSVIERVAELRVADSEDPPGPCAIELCDERGRRLDLAAASESAALDLGTPRRLALSVPLQCQLESPNLLMFRLHAADGARLPSLPFMAEPPRRGALGAESAAREPLTGSQAPPPATAR